MVKDHMPFKVLYYIPKEWGT